TWQDDADEELSLPGVTVVPLGAHYTPAKFDLTLLLARAGRAGRAGDGALDYAAARFGAGTASRYVRYLRRVLALMVAGPDQAVGALELTDEQERRELLEWGTVSQARRPRALGELFDAAVARAPDAVAVSFERQSLTY